MSATERMKQKNQEEEKTTNLRDSGMKEQSFIAVMLSKIIKIFSRPKVKLLHEKSQKMTAALGLSQKHLRILRDKFDDIDVDGSGNIDSVEFFESMGEMRSKITDELFSMMDLDGNARLDFDEYRAAARTSAPGGRSGSRPRRRAATRPRGLCPAAAAAPRPAPADHVRRPPRVRPAAAAAGRRTPRA